jgi:1-acyl-sn-glycerol-3-phosphate acyltransferase
VVPAYLKGTYDVLPTGAWWPRRRPVTVRFGAPLRFETSERKDKAENKRFYEMVSRTVIEHIAALGEVPSPLVKDGPSQDGANAPIADARNAE